MVFVHSIPDIRIGISHRPTVLPCCLTLSIQPDLSIRKLSILEINHFPHRFICVCTLDTTIGIRIIHHDGKRIGIHSFRHIDRTGNAEAIVVIDRHFAGLSLLGCDKNHTKWCARTINTGSGSILQNRDILNILRIDRINVTDHTIN